MFSNACFLKVLWWNNIAVILSWQHSLPPEVGGWLAAIEFLYF